jgi:RNA polymerase sigma-70 factor (ECF subfamily)
MTGSLTDAEDLVQECLIRAWRGLPSFEGRSSLRTWLYKIATNACLSELAARPHRALPTDFAAAGDPATAPAAPVLDPIWLDPAPASVWLSTRAGPEARLSARESVALAFLAALQQLPPLQRAVVVLREVLGWSAEEAAELLDTTVAAANSALQRARATLEARRDRLEAGTLATPLDAAMHALLRRYVEAWESGDVQALAALLREDAILTMPPVPTWFSGRAAIATALAPLMAHMGSFRLQPTEAAGGVAFAAYLRAPGDDRLRAQAIHVLSLGPDGLVTTVHVFMSPSLFGHFGLPAELVP